MPFADRTKHSFLALRVCFSSDMGQRRWGTLQFLRAFSICVMVMNVRLPSCDSWAITFYQDFCKTPVTVNIDGKMQLGMVINATVANNAKTLAPDRCEQYCEAIGGTWKNADERENWANLTHLDVTR